MTKTCADLTNDVTQLFLDALADGQWQFVADLQKTIPDDLADAKCDQSRALNYSDLPDKKDYGRPALAGEAIKALQDMGQVETRGKDPKVEIRLTPRAENKADHTQKQETTPLVVVPATEKTAKAPASTKSAVVGDEQKPATPIVRPVVVPAAEKTASAPASTKSAEVREEQRPATAINWLPVDKLHLHAKAEKIPRMKGDQWKNVKEDMLRNGIKDAIKVQKGGIVIDGRHRLEVAKERGDTEIACYVVDLSDEEQILEIYRSAALRRHLSDDQRAVLASRFMKAESQQAKKDRARKGGQAGGRGRKKLAPDSSAPPGGAKLSEKTTPQPRTPRAGERAAATFNVSKKKVAQAAAVEAVSPELADKVQTAETTLAQATRKVRASKTTSKPAADKQPDPKFVRMGDKAQLTMRWPPEPSALAKLAQVLYGNLGNELAKQLNVALGHLVQEVTPGPDAN